MKSDNTEEIRQLTALATNRAQEEEIVQKATEIKTRLITSWQEIIKSVNVIDGLVAVFAPNQQWQPGLAFTSSVNLQPPIPARAIPPRIVPPIPRMTTAKAVNADLVLRIANEFSSKGQPVNSKQVAIRLRAEGDQRTNKAIETSVSNILSRRGWGKVRPGEYSLITDADTKTKNNEGSEPIL